MSGGRRDYDPLRPWRVGDRVEYLTTDADDGDLRELDGTEATVLACQGTGEPILVESIYGKRWDDPYCFVTPSPRGGGA